MAKPDRSLTSYKEDETDEATKVFQEQLEVLQDNAHDLLPVHVNVCLDSLSVMINELPKNEEMREQYREDPEVTREIYHLRKNLQQCKRVATTFSECAVQLADYLGNDRIIETVREGIYNGDKDTVESFFCEIHRRQTPCCHALDTFVGEIGKNEIMSGRLQASVLEKKRNENREATAAEKKAKSTKRYSIGFGISAVPLILLPPFAIIAAGISRYFYLQSREAKANAEYHRRCEAFYKEAMNTLFSLQSYFHDLQESMTNCQQHLETAEKIVSHIIKVRMNCLHITLEQEHANNDFTHIIDETKDLEINAATSSSGHENI